MMLLNIIKRFFYYFIIKIKDLQALAELEQKYPDSQFYSGAKINNSSFEKYNVINTGVIIDSCKIGAHTYIQKNTTIFNANIGRFCSIATNVSIGPGIHNMNGISTHPSFYLKDTPLAKTYSNKDLYDSTRRTLIGNDVWIGERAIILDGVKIGNGAIIAAGSVVTKDVEPYTIVGGVPAKLIRSRFDQATMLRIEESKWWYKSEEWLEQNYKAFCNPSDFLKNAEL